MVEVVFKKSQKNKLILRQHIGTVDIDGVGECDLSVSHNFLNTFVEFPDGTIIGLNFNSFITECYNLWKKENEKTDDEK